MNGYELAGLSRSTGESNRNVTGERLMALLAGQSGHFHPALGPDETWPRLVMEQMPAVLWTTDRELRFTSSTGAGLKGVRPLPGKSLGTPLFDSFWTNDPEFLPIRVHRGPSRGSRDFLPWIGAVGDSRRM